MSASEPSPDETPSTDPDGAAFDAFLELLERGERPAVHAFLEAHPGVSPDLAAHLERLAAEAVHGPVPDRFGPYEVLDLLGRGGMGAVYLARDPELDREVAVKVLARPGSGAVGEARIARLRDEARILAALDHSAIARVFSFGRSDAGTPYIVMERVPGEDLHRRLRSGPLPWRVALDVLSATAGALAEAHRHGIVHRDLKPGNLMLLEGGGVKLLDFGLGASSGVLVRGSDGSSVHGTPGYMSPEQRRGDPHSTRDDVWALGRLGLDAVGVGDLDVDAGLPRAAPAAVPGALWNVLCSFLAEKPEDRPADGAEAERALVGAAELLRARSAARRLPPERTRLVGRSAEIDRLRTALRDGGVVTLVGPGGVGKSRLARRVASERIEPHWVALAGVAPGEVGAWVTQALGGRVGPNEPVEEALARVACDLDAGALVVLDNCEHVEEEARSIARTLAVAGEATVCATSRAPLGVPDEVVLQVAPLATRPAAELFLDRARRAGLRGAASSDDVDTICARLDRLPLALELAAARVPEVGVGALRDRLEGGGDTRALLTARTGTRDERHRDLDALVEWSVDLLEPGARRAFACLAVFADGWTLRAAEAVLGADALDRLAELTRRSLVTRDPGRERWLLLETVRRVAERALGSEAEDARARHAAYFLGLAEDLAARTLGSERAAAFLELEENARDIAAALRAASSGASSPELAALGWRVSSALFEFWIARGRLREGHELHAAVLAGPHEPTDGEAAQALLTRGTIAARLGRHGDARADFVETIRLARAAGDRQLEARGLRNRAYGAMLEKRLEGVAADLEASLTIARELGDEATVGMLLNDLGIHWFYQGEFGRAVAFYTESLALRRRLGDEWGIASSLGNLGEARQGLGEYERAREELATSVVAFHDLGCLRSVAESFEMSAGLELAVGDTERSAVLSGAAEGLRARFGFPIPPAEESAYAEDVARTRERLGEARWKALRTQGAALEVEEAIAVALGERDVT